MLQKLKKTNSIVVIGPGPYGGEATAYSKETKIGVTALELNKRYVESGKKTAAGNKTKIKFIHSDLFTPFSTKNKLPNKVDYFIWNPPYVDSDTVKKNKLAISAADGGPTGIEVMSRALSEFKQLPPIQQTAKLAFCINTKRLRQQTVIKMIKDESFSVQEIFEVKHSPCKVFILKLHVASQ
jgi:methylase of polypeptide subunit release factors